MILFHTGLQEIPQPDIRYGRKNADFGQGFYLSPDREFACRWAKEREDRSSILNIYDLDEKDLRIKSLQRDEEWFSYIFANRHGQPDMFAEYDVITGPIANDTLYDTMGILTSGFLSGSEALAILRLGAEYMQWAVKSEKALSRLRWLRSDILPKDKTASYRKTVQEEEKNFQELLAAKLQSFE